MKDDRQRGEISPEAMEASEQELARLVEHSNDLIAQSQEVVLRADRAAHRSRALKLTVKRSGAFDLA